MQVDKNVFLNESKNKGNVSKEKVDALMEQLSDLQKEKVKDILTDETQLQTLLNSPAAKKIIEQLKGKE